MWMKLRCPLPSRFELGWQDRLASLQLRVSAPGRLNMGPIPIMLAYHGPDSPSFRIGICLQPFDNFRYTGGPVTRDQIPDKWLDHWIGYHLAAGVDFIYLYDRRPEARAWVHKYPQVQHISARPFSEVMWRGGQHPQPAFPDHFPAIYDQVSDWDREYAA